MQRSSPDLVGAALAYAARGIAIFPLAPKSKLPLISKKFGGRGVCDATTNLDQIVKWWGINSRANIGIATGAASNFFVVDVDPRHGGDETLAELERSHGMLPTTVVSHTGGGGLHLLFRHVDGIANSAGDKLGPGLDIRSSGGYVVGPPSVHENGRIYAWDCDCGIDDMVPAEAPAWLVQLASGPTKTSGTGMSAELPETWRRLVADGVGEGARNVAVARLAGHLLRRGVDPLVTLDLCRCWNAQRCRPPLNDDEIMRTVDSICRREIGRRGEHAC
jgi:hypothetical protein